MKKNNNEINNSFANCKCYKGDANDDKSTNQTINGTFTTNYDYDKITTNKVTYRCAICGKAYDTIDERVACETKCLADRKKAQAELEKKKKLEEKNSRKTEIEKKYKELATLVNDYCKDYGYLQIGESKYFDGEYPTPYKLLGWWS